MRWALVKVCLAVTVMVVVAFAVPLGLVVKEMARDRALTNAERIAAGIGPALAITTDAEQLERAVGSTEAGAGGRIAVHVPRGSAEGMPAVRIGEPRAGAADVERASGAGTSLLVAVAGGHALLQPIAVEGDRVAVVEVFVPAGELTEGVALAWLVLAGVGLALIAGSVAVADRLGTRMVRPARRLAGAAHDLGEGKLGVRVEESGPSELRSAAVAFNSMADQVALLLANERELAADLSHRLRTPLTVLRLNAASLGESGAAEQTRQAVAQLEREIDQIIATVREQRGRPAGPQAAAVAGCDVSAVIRERMEFWSALAEDERRSARLAGVDRPAQVPVARAELVAAIDALIGNVFRHTPEGTDFSVDVHHAGDAVIVLASDAGPGIRDPEAALARGQGQGGPGSTGLGLDIVRRVAESTGGDVRIGRSVLGGAEIRLWLALSAGPAAADGERRRQRHRVVRRRRGRAAEGSAAGGAGDGDGTAAAAGAGAGARRA
ncbi:HAMP domain-containing sensor histidine kinase [Streptomyces sp. B22F1]|uniref:HAMP domain-containing sensor histidine kinase n=1 Tax=Streptomyces sp. B22F1 TaxID=3153566 RepID=UPI00325CEFF5